jgi:bacterioferritin (cytochrome b1)
MTEVKQKLADLLNRALELEHAARVQYLTHAEQIKGLYSEKIIERLKELASDEEKHENIFRNLIGSYLGIVPTMGFSQTKNAKDTNEILKINLGDEKAAVDFYKTIYSAVVDNKKELPYEFERLEHDVRHVILDEEEHIVELSVLLAK